MIQIPIHYFTSTKKEDLENEITQYETKRGYGGGGYVILMRDKYDWEKQWEEAAEFISHYWGSQEYFMWDNDWDEGQQDVEFIGLIDTHEIAKIFFTNRKKGIVKQ